MQTDPKPAPGHFPNDRQRPEGIRELQLLGRLLLHDPRHRRHLRRSQLARRTGDGLGFQRVGTTPVVGLQLPIDRPPIKPQPHRNELGALPRLNPLDRTAAHFL